MSFNLIAETAKLPAILAVARDGSPSAAAQRIGLQPSTLYRQIQSAEHAVGSPLFFRRNGTWTPTPIGKRLVDIAVELESRLIDFNLVASAHDQRAEGLLRVTASDAQANFYLSGKLADFKAHFPLLTVELIVTNRRLDLANGDADIALRPHSQPGDGLVGRRVGRILHAVYGAQHYLDRIAPIRSYDDLHHAEIIDYGQKISHFSAAQSTANMLRGKRTVARFDSITSMARAVEAGLGLAVLPCFVGDQLVSTRKLFLADDGLPSDIWLLCHKSQRRSPKVSNFVRYFANIIRRDSLVFEGRAGNV